MEIYYKMMDINQAGGRRGQRNRRGGRSAPSRSGCAVFLLGKHQEKVRNLGRERGARGLGWLSRSFHLRDPVSQGSPPKAEATPPYSATAWALAGTGCAGGSQPFPNAEVLQVKEEQSGRAKCPVQGTVGPPNTKM